MAIAKEIGPAFYIGVSAIAIATLVFAFPPIISRGGGLSPDPKIQTVTRDQHAYCQSNMSDVNCACYAKKAAHIMTQKQPQMRGYTYADRSQLARGQASSRC